MSDAVHNPAGKTAAAHAALHSSVTKAELPSLPKVVGWRAQLRNRWTLERAVGRISRTVHPLEKQMHHAERQLRQRRDRVLRSSRRSVRRARLALFYHLIRDFIIRRWHLLLLLIIFVTIAGYLYLYWDETVAAFTALQTAISNFFTPPPPPAPHEAPNYGPPFDAWS